MTQGAAADRRIGMWAALTVVALGLAYVITGAVGYFFGADQPEHFGVVDPALAVLEVLIILSVPPMITMMAALHAGTRSERQTYSRVALAFMVLLGGVTTAIHFVELTVVRRIDPAHSPGLANILSFRWPSAIFALDLLAWDVFLGLSMLFAARAVDRDARDRRVRYSLLATGALCLAGTLGPVSGDLRFQVIAIAGYAFMFPLTCLVVAQWFRRPADG
jgi:hypothetical protein